MLVGDVDDERRLEFVSHHIVDEPLGDMFRTAFGIVLRKPGLEGGDTYHLARRVVVRVVRHPAAAENDPGAILADGANGCKLRFVRRTDVSIGKTQVLADRQAHDLSGAFGLPGALGGRAPRAHLAPGHVHDADGIALFGELDERPPQESSTSSRWGPKAKTSSFTAGPRAEGPAHRAPTHRTGARRGRDRRAGYTCATEKTLSCANPSGKSHCAAWVTCLRSSASRRRIA